MRAGMFGCGDFTGLNVAMGRDINGKSGAAGDLTFEIDVPAMILNDPMDDTQAETGSAFFVCLFGGEEGVENAVLDILGDAASGVGKTDFNIFPGIDHFVLAKWGIEVDVFCPDGKRAGIPHGINGILADVLHNPQHLVPTAFDLHRT